MHRLWLANASFCFTFLALTQSGCSRQREESRSFDEIEYWMDRQMEWTSTETGVPLRSYGYGLQSFRLPSKKKYIARFMFYRRWFDATNRTTEVWLVIENTDPIVKMQLPEGQVDCLRRDGIGRQIEELLLDAADKASPNPDYHRGGLGRLPSEVVVMYPSLKKG
jgi:hypothetical protein